VCVTLMKYLSTCAIVNIAFDSYNTTESLFIDVENNISFASDLASFMEH
ncbi:hypothetical protein A2U01_0012989, partial [Trifolium medium]|nr:hypothetical protein [Trifolium medium]